MPITRRWSIARQLFVLQVLVVTTLVAIGTAGAVRLAQEDTEQAAIDQVVGIAYAVANSPTVVEALHERNPSAILQPYTESVRLATNTNFIVVMARDRTRFTHTSPELIGRPFIGSIDDALHGGTVVEKSVGTLGESVRTVVPVTERGAVVALVSVGITTHALNQKLLSRTPAVAFPTALALLIAAAGSWLLSRRLRRQTHGLGPAEMTRMYEYHDAVLHSVREGLVVADRAGRVTLVNDEGRRLLGLTDDSLDMPPEVSELLAAKTPVADEPVLAGDRMLVANQRVIRSEGQTVGTVLTLRDHTELRTLTGELDSVRGLTEALRSQAHEAANRLHTVLTMVELGRTEEALQLATAELAVAQQLTDQVVGSVSEPALAALLLGKSAQAAERGAQLVIDDDSRLGDPTPLPSRDLITVVGNLVDNALEAVAGTEAPRVVTVLVRESDGEVLVRVGDTGPGLPEGAFARGWSTKAQGRGLGLALVKQVSDRLGGSIDVTAAPGGGAQITVRLPVPAVVP
ncbi:ATP-binding protein [Paractinoplanes lichenicola]|uniref:histidine kinase n=1 Tax=Paractinoplanes lichenicola TaxID=2802976 RepID=A0ABS1VYR5_9ACTN|nr:sensor histidine kinase [Actinoplanes lichenicola]MBL7259443.1 sensor histidine kinase [Actinoplanes lichenicola]